MRPGFKKVSSVWALSFNHRFIHDGLRMTSFYDAWDFAEHRMWSAFAVEEKRLEIWLESRLMLRGWLLGTPTATPSAMEVADMCSRLLGLAKVESDLFCLLLDKVAKSLRGRWQAEAQRSGGGLGRVEHCSDLSLARWCFGCSGDSALKWLLGHLT